MFYMDGRIRTIQMRQSGGLSLAAGLDGGNTLITSNPSSSAIRFTLDSSESRGFFLPFSAFDVRIVLNFKGGFFVSLTVFLISIQT